MSLRGGVRKLWSCFTWAKNTKKYWAKEAAGMRGGPQLITSCCLGQAGAWQELEQEGGGEGGRGRHVIARRTVQCAWRCSRARIGAKTLTRAQTCDNVVVPPQAGDGLGPGVELGQRQHKGREKTESKRRLIAPEFRSCRRTASRRTWKLWSP
jgi:hypothetical protein